MPTLVVGSSVFIKYYPKYKYNQINKAELARLCGVSRPTIYKYLRIYEKQVGYKEKINAIRLIRE